MRDALAGWHTFSRSLLNIVQAGEVTTYLPRGTSTIDMMEFTQGGKLPPKDHAEPIGAIPNADGVLVHKIHSFVSANNNRGLPY